MPITREKKEKIVKEITENFKNSVISVITDYRGLNVGEISDLRKKAREKEVEYKITKNTLFLKALENAGIEIDEGIFSKPIAIAFGYKDEVDSPKILNEFAKEHDNLEILGGIVDGKYATRETILNLANLPGREELYAKIVGSLAAPLRNLGSVLQGNLRGLVSVLSQYKEKIS